MVHIWEYDSFAHRKSVRAALAEDPEWTGIYIAPLVKYLEKQDNVALTLLPWSEVEQPEHPGGDEALFDFHEMSVHSVAAAY